MFCRPPKVKTHTDTVFRAVIFRSELLGSRRTDQCTIQLPHHKNIDNSQDKRLKLIVRIYRENLEEKASQDLSTRFE